VLEIDYIIFNMRRKNLEELPENYFYEFGTYNILPKKIEISSDDDIIFTWKMKDYYFYKSFYWYELNYIDEEKGIKIISKCKHNRNIRILKVNDNLFYLTNGEGEKITKEVLKKYGLEDLIKYKRKHRFDIFLMKKPITKIEQFLTKVFLQRRKIIDTHYVITLNKIKEFIGEDYLKSILDEILNNEKQLKEWKELFDIEIKNKNDLLNNKDYQNLPIDTRYFSSDFKQKLLASLNKKNNLDDILDGILIKGENFQALNLLLDKYYEKIQTIYIDPPFNKKREANFPYKVGYNDATWITMLENRIRLGKELLNKKGSIFVRCDYSGNMYVRLLMNEIFGKENFRNEIVVNRVKKVTPEQAVKFTVDYDNLYLYSKSEDFCFVDMPKKKVIRKSEWHSASAQGRHEPRIFFGIELYPPRKNRGWFTQKKIDTLISKKELRLVCRDCGYIHMEGNLESKYCPKCGAFNWKVEYLMKPKDYYYIGNNWTDISGYTYKWGFPTENSEPLLKRVISSTSNEGDLVLDFFLGSGTTTAVAHKLKRKWIGVEMGEHFYTVILPRMKKVLFYDKTGISRDKDVKEKYNKNSAGGFFKYHILEQYEDALSIV